MAEQSKDAAAQRRQQQQGEIPQQQRGEAPREKTPQAGDPAPAKPNGPIITDWASI